MSFRHRLVLNTMAINGSIQGFKNTYVNVLFSVKSPLVFIKFKTCFIAFIDFG